MAETPSTMLSLGSIAHDFTLWDTLGENEYSLSDQEKCAATVIMFICNHCPYVKHIQEKMVAVADEYQRKDCRFIAINSNDGERYPADDQSHMKVEGFEHGYSFPYLYDETQAVAKAYQAACTPDFYVFDRNLSLVYRGRFDDSTPNSGRPVTGKDLCQALDAILAGKAVDSQQLPSLGCNIKWKL